MKDASHKEYLTNMLAKDLPYAVEIFTAMLESNNPEEIQAALRQAIEVFKRLSRED